MNPDFVIRELSRNRRVIRSLLRKIDKEQYLWKPAPDQWCLLEVICHLYDEEREDFRTRVSCVLKNPKEKLPSIDPQGWVKDWHYIEQYYAFKLKAFLKERKTSVKWLKSLENPAWENTHHHPKLGALSAKMFLVNWLEHDYLHIRQINRIKHQYIAAHTNESLRYAGEW